MSEKKDDGAVRGRLRSVEGYDQEIARNQRLRARASRRARAAARRARARRLAILGGELIRLCRADDQAARLIVERKLENLAAGEVKPFEGWTWNG